MKKIISGFMVLSLFGLFSACLWESGENHENVEKESTENPIDLEQMKDRNTQGMDIDSYSAEVTPMQEKGKTY